MKSQYLKTKFSEYRKGRRIRILKSERKEAKIPFPKGSLGKSILLIYYAVAMMGMYRIAYHTVIKSETVAVMNQFDVILLKIGLTAIFTVFIIDVFTKTNKHIHIAYHRFVFIRKLKKERKIKLGVNPYIDFDNVPVGEGRKK